MRCFPQKVLERQAELLVINCWIAVKWEARVSKATEILSGEGRCCSKVEEEIKKETEKIRKEW